MHSERWAEYLETCDAVMALADEAGCSWDDGGCATLAAGLLSIQPAGSVAYLVDADGTCQHVVFQLRGEYIDACGSHDAAELLEVWGSRAGVVAIADRCADCSIPVYDAAQVLASDATLAALLS